MKQHLVLVAVLLLACGCAFVSAETSVNGTISISDNKISKGDKVVILGTVQNDGDTTISSGTYTLEIDKDFATSYSLNFETSGTSPGVQCVLKSLSDAPQAVCTIQDFAVDGYFTAAISITVTSVPSSTFGATLSGTDLADDVSASLPTGGDGDGDGDGDSGANNLADLKGFVLETVQKYLF
eukprot:TRINITY_DN1384_c0_g1_i1.p1 TRINITY_DN1384_c0_g1~~TRINITY_DN1384_c0_g1_i1.p1  ORF type:complete len:182 (+),score=30.84 TRINITY_DN1384_c0_g1_i1:46-591(+)